MMKNKLKNIPITPYKKKVKTNSQSLDAFLEIYFKSNITPDFYNSIIKGI